MSTGAEISPLVVSLREGANHYLRTSSEQAMIALDSSALMHLGAATLKNLPYVSAASKFGINDISHFFSSRITYFESAFVCLALLVHNVVMALVYTPLVILSCGLLSENLNYSCKKHWYHSYHSFVGVGIGLLGFFVPKYGLYGTAFFGYSIFQSLKASYSRDVGSFEDHLLGEIKSIVQKHRQLIYNATRHQVGHSQFEQEFRPSYMYMEAKLSQMQKMDELATLAVEFWRDFPKMGPENQRFAARRKAMSRLGSPAGSDWYK